VTRLTASAPATINLHREIIGRCRGGSHELAAGPGSDVPSFLRAGPAVGVGRGDQVSALPEMAELAVVAAVPPAALPAAEVCRPSDARLTWDRQEATVYAFAAGVDE
jgi:4-diphosphocytidyl-2C-methyl-D-erythritol kinase